MTKEIIEQVNEKLGFCGVGGTGKTAGAKLYIMRAEKPAIIIDPEAEFRKTHIKDSLNILFFQDYKELMKYLVKYNYIWYSTNQKLVLEGSLGRSKEEKKTVFEKLMGWLFDNFTKFIIYVDEIEKFYNQKDDSIMGEILDCSRNREIDLVFTFKRFAKVHNDLLAALSQFYVYKMTLPSDIKRLSGYIGNAASYLNSLKKFQFIFIDVDESIPQKGQLCRLMPDNKTPDLKDPKSVLSFV